MVNVIECNYGIEPILPLECPEDLTQEFIRQLTKRLQPFIYGKHNRTVYIEILHTIESFFKEFKYSIREFDEPIPRLFVVVDVTDPRNIIITEFPDHYRSSFETWRYKIYSLK